MSGLILALGLVLAGLALPVHYQAVAPSVLAVAQEQGENLDYRTEELLRRSQTGPAEQFITALRELGETAGELQAQLDATLEAHPEFAASGGPSTFFDAFYTTLRKQPETGHSAVELATLLAASDNRAQLTGFLEASADPTVAAMLETRQLTGWQRLYPVDVPGGAALDIAVLSSSLLVQSGAFSDAALRQLDKMLRGVEQGEDGALLELERLYLSILTSAGRFNWLTLKTWVDSAPDITALIRIAPYLRDAEKPAVLYATVVMSKDPVAVAGYLDRFPDRGWSNLQRALVAGSSGLALLLEEGRPLYEAPAWMALFPALPPEVITFAFHHRNWALFAMTLAWLAAGWLLAVSFKMLVWGTARVHQRRSVDYSQDLILALCLFLGLAVATEPALLSQNVTEPGKLFLEFELEPQTANIVNQSMDISSIDQITLLVLLIFFVIQLIIYTACLVKIGQIRRAPVPAEVRLRLLENEETLFDSGLYVGLAGTVISLLMLALGVVQASLVAAYASTLFGIIFVALLKILHVRPLRRRIILEANRLG